MSAELDTYDVTVHFVNGKSETYLVPRHDMSVLVGTLRQPDGLLIFPTVVADTRAKHYVPVRTVAYLSQIDV